MQFPTCPSSGNFDAHYMLVGEAPGREEIERQMPFVGASGQLIRSTLAQNGFAPAEFFITNVCKLQPPGNKIEAFMLSAKEAAVQGLDDIPPYYIGARKVYPNALIRAGMRELEAEILRVRPRAIVALGNLPLWYFTGETGITSWRGSELFARLQDFECPLLPTLHPAFVLRSMASKPELVRDIKRLRDNLDNWGPTDLQIIIPDTYEQALDALHYLDKFQRYTVDIETKLRSQVLCVGFGISSYEAVVFPFVSNEHPLGYYTPVQEIDLIRRLDRILRDPAKTIGNQNFAYDRQFLARMWGVLPRMDFDTMIAQSVLYPGTLRNLAYLSSLYCQHHKYWKDDLKDWKEETTPDRTLFTYNGEDCCRTFEIADVLHQELKAAHLYPQYQIQLDIANVVMRMMLRGVAKDFTQSKALEREVELAIREREDWLRSVLPGLPDRWWASSDKLKKLCYDAFGVKPILDKKTKQPSVNKEAIPIIASREPILRPILTEVLEIRALEKSSEVLHRGVDPCTQRWYTDFTTAGTKTMRFTSSENAFGFGCNLQNISSGKDLSKTVSSSKLRTPNLRKMFAPDPGHILFDVDLERADAQFVAYDSGDAALKDTFVRARIDHSIDPHMENAIAIFGPNAGKAERTKAKQGVHAANYSVGERTLGMTLGITTAQARTFLDSWFSAHPAIKQWHIETERQLLRDRTIRNVFGYRIVFFDRIEGVLSEALGWQGQSGTALVCGLAMVKLDKLPYITLLLQVHDSLIFQMPIADYPYRLPEILSTLETPAPYPDDPLIIPWSAKASLRNWGECIDIPWDNPPPIEVLQGWGVSGLYAFTAPKGSFDSLTVNTTIACSLSAEDFPLQFNATVVWRHDNNDYAFIAIRAVGVAFQTNQSHLVKNAKFSGTVGDLQLNNLKPYHG